ncbi:MAG TPA: DUF2125 domain-containing protein [Rhizomicrobium sp.]|jgi:hypothetical protein
MRYSHRFFLYAPVAAFIAVFALAGAYWWVAAGTFFKALDAANGQELAPGVTLHFASHQDGGFPFRIETLMQNARLEVATSYGPLTWSTEQLAMHALTYGRDQIIYEAAGKQTLSWTDSEHAHHVWTFVPGSLRASSIVVNGALARFDMDIVGIGSPELSAGGAQIHIRRDPSKHAIDIFFSGDAVHLSGPLQSGFGDTIKTLRVGGSFVPGASLAPLLGGKADWRSAFEAWRAAGGKLGIDRFELAWGKLDAGGTGTLALDSLHRPQGALALKLANYPEFLATAKASPDTPLASALLADREPANPPTLALALTFKNGTVTAGATAAGTVNPLY